MSNVKRALPWLRRMAGALALAGFVVLFLGLEWRFVSWLAPIVKLQFMPAVLAFNVAVAVTVLAVTILTGRLYCSVLCPLGLMQDAAGRVGRMLRKVFRRPPRGPAAPSQPCRTWLSSRPFPAPASPRPPHCRRRRRSTPRVRAHPQVSW